MKLKKFCWKCVKIYLYVEKNEVLKTCESDVNPITTFHITRCDKVVKFVNYLTLLITED